MTTSDHPTTMTAGIVTEFGHTITVGDYEVPKPGHRQALIKMLASGVCHTDLHALEGDWPVKPNPPFVPGHEGVGEVVALGEETDPDVKIGDLLGLVWNWSSCGACENCRSGWETLCDESTYGGYTIDGSFGQYALVDTHYAARIPEGANPVEVAPILCAGVTVYKALKRTEVRPGQWVTISGIGGLGHVAVQYAKAMGMRVVAVDVTEEKLQLARDYGAEITVNAREVADPAAEVQEKTGGGTHGVLVTAVHESAFGQAIGMARKNGTIVFNGLPPGEFPASVFEIVLKGLTIRGSLVGDRQDLAEALDFYARGLVTPRVQECALEDINAVFDWMRDGKIDGRIAIKY